MGGAARPGKPVPDGTEERLARFTELVATAFANNQAREHLAQLASEPPALGRVATLVAREARPSEIFSVVSNEVGRLFGSDQAAVARYEPDGSGVVVVGVSRGIRGVSAGTRWPLEDFLGSTTVYRTGHSTRKERSGCETASGPIADGLRETNFVSSVAALIVVEGNVLPSGSRRTAAGGPRPRLHAAGSVRSTELSSPCHAGLPAGPRPAPGPAR